MLKQHKKFTKKELKKDPLLIFAAEASDFIRAHGAKIAAIAGGVILVAAVAVLVSSVNRKNNIAAYDTAYAAAASNAPEAADLIRKVAFKSDGERSAEMLLLLGSRYYESGDLANAEKCYARFIKKFGKDQVAAFTAYQNLGGIYEEKGDFKAAAETYLKYTRKFKDSSLESKMLLSAGKAFQRAGDMAAAKEYFQTVADGSGDSRDKQDALACLETIN